MNFFDKRKYLKKQELLRNIIVGFSSRFPFLYELSMEIKFNLIPESECIFKGSKGLIIFRGLLDYKKAKEREYNVYINYQMSNHLFYRTVLHEIGHIVDLIAGENISFITNEIQDFEKIMKSESQFVDDINYSLQEFFAEAFAYIVSGDRKAFNLFRTGEKFKEIITIAEVNYKKQKRTAR